MHKTIRDFPRDEAEDNEAEAGANTESVESTVYDGDVAFENADDSDSVREPVEPEVTEPDEAETPESAEDAEVCEVGASEAEDNEVLDDRELLGGNWEQSSESESDLVPTYQLDRKELFQGRLNWWTRSALTFAPLYSLCYDLQMRLGGGVREARHRLALPGIQRSTPTLRTAFLTDLHLGPASGRVAARQAWNLARDFAPDMLLLGGDFFWGDARGLPALLRELKRWRWDRPKAGIYTVLGNHDYSYDVDTLTMALEACDVRVLRNEAVQLPHPWEQIWLSGLDDIDRGTPDIEAALHGVPKNACSIMLSHSPDVCGFPELKRCALTICGDTHGGQIATPNGDPIVMSSTWGKQFPYGLHRHNGNWVFVSRGIGTIRIPIRMFAPPDVGLFEISGRGAGVSR
jgi:predicted MPP superfamily phosphohydrolase